jgi:hypothetical protein
MKSISQLLVAITIGIMLAGCSNSAKMMNRMSQSERTDVFTEGSVAGPAPAGFADIVIKASLKTPLEGDYPLESKMTAHGESEHTFLMNIDGQAVQWNVKGIQHELPLYIDGKTSHDPEAGTGMKYVLEKKIRLMAGAHNVFFGLPGDMYYTAKEITVNSGMIYVLEFKPHYWFKEVPTRSPTFLEGINSYEIILSVQEH